MTNPKVSVIVPCYNQEKYLGETLDSVIAQTYKNWECIIINDGSVDNSESIAKEYVRRDSRFKYIYQENQGVVSARNNAIKQSCGKYILPLDGDDLIAEDYLELAVPIMEKDDSIGLVYCEVKLFGSRDGDFVLRPLNMRNILTGGCCVNTSMFRRVDFEYVGGFKECMRNGWEDWDLFISLLEKGVQVYKIEKPLFFYRIMSNSRERSIRDKDSLKSIVVSNHSLTYFEEYSKLLKDYEKINKHPFYINGVLLYNERPLFRRLIHLSLILMNKLSSLLKILRL